MNTIIIHPFNRTKNTSMHDMSAALIAPVSGWYRKPTPWWIDGFEEVGLKPIVETDEIAEEDDDDVYEQEEPPVEDGESDVVALADAEPTRENVTFEDLQGDGKGEQTKNDMFQDIALEDIGLDDLPEIHGDPRDDDIYFLGDVMLVDEASFDYGDKSEGDDTLTDITFVGEEATVILEAKIVDEYDWDEKAMMNIVVEVDLENDGDECVPTNVSTTAPVPTSLRIKY